MNDQAIPTDREINVIAAIGPLNSRGEANSHSHTGDDHTTDDIKIDFSSKNEHSCTSSLYDRKDEVMVKPWPSRTLIGENVITVRIGPTGGKRGYTAITGLQRMPLECVLFTRSIFICFRSSIVGNCLVFERFADSRSLCGTRPNLHLLSRGWK